MGTTCRAKKPIDFGCDPDGNLISNFVPSIQYTAPKEVFFADFRQHQGEQGRLTLRLLRHYYVDQALRYFLGYLCGVYRFTGCPLCLHIVDNKFVDAFSKWLAHWHTQLKKAFNLLRSPFPTSYSLRLSATSLVGAMDNVHVMSTMSEAPKGTMLGLRRGFLDRNRPFAN